jgi:O-antigen/teichoic acid export membrane protein
MFENYKEKFFRNNNLLTLGSSSIFGYAVLGIFWFFLARYVGPDEFGEISYFFAIGTIAVSLSTAGLQSGITVFSSRDTKISNLFLSLGIITSIIASVITFIFISHVEISLFIIGVSFFGLYVYSILGKKLYYQFSILSISQKTLSVIFALILYHIIGIEGIILGFAISYFLLSKGTFNFILKQNFTLTNLKPNIKFILNNSISDSTHNLVWWSDRFILLPLYGFNFLGNYQLGMHILLMLTIIPMIFYNYLLPHDSTGTAKNKIRLLSILLSTCVAIFSLIVGPTVIEFLFPQYTDTTNLIQIFSLTLIPISINLVFSSYFLGRKKTKIIAIGNSLLLGMQLTLIFIFSTLYGSEILPFAILIAFISQTIFFSIMKILDK